MEMNAAIVAQHKFSRGKTPTDEIQEIVDNAVPVTKKKKATKFGMTVFYGTYQFSFLKSWTISNTTVEILRIHEYYVTKQRLL